VHLHFFVYCVMNGIVIQPMCKNNRWASIREEAWALVVDEGEHAGEHVAVVDAMKKTAG
jgi:hypothetical protein